jgi:hypothetical protein
MLRRGFFAIALIAALGVAPAIGWAQAEKRVALVIGNSAYKEGGALKNPVNDARVMATALRELGFRVIARENATKQQMERAVGEFGDALAAGAVGLFYYAGHGLQVNGRNFLVPVDASIGSESRVRLETLDADLVIEQMASVGSAVNLVLLDACRNNPFERRFRSSGAGLAQINAPKGTLIAYSTAPGTVAADGDGANSIYTAKLVQAIKTPGLPIEEVFKRVRIEVSRETKDAQTPWEASSLIGSFYFVEPKKAPAGPSEAEKEMMYWDSVKNSDDPVVLNAYLDRYPNGTFAAVARAKMRAAAEHKRLASLPPPAPPPPSTADKEAAVWDLVKNSSDPEIFETFLEKYPKGANAAAAQSRLDALRKAQQAKAQVSPRAPVAPPPAPVAPPPPASSQTAVPAARQPAPTGETEDQLWERVGNSGDPAALRAYLDRYPDGIYGATAAFRLDAMSGPSTQVAIAPAAAAPAKARDNSIDGIWHGTYRCGMSPKAGQGAFSAMDRMFIVKQGQLRGKWEGRDRFTEIFQGTISPDGKLVINGTGEDRHFGSSYSMSFEGKAEGGKFQAKGRHFDRQCELSYWKLD